MNGRLRMLLPTAVFVAALAAAGPAPGEVRIVEDEVLFSVRAPAAKEVFLVGDFNNWNPTYEKMERVNGRFEVRLFLLPGTYRYKFVVDGEWIFDPDDAAADTSTGSLVVLVERAGALTFGGEAAAEEEDRVRETLTPSARYSGAFLLESGETESMQVLDVWVSHESDRVSARAGFNTAGESWKLSPLRAEVLFNEGYIDVKIGDAVLKGFENETVWSSSDPFGLVGAVGVWDYSAGFDRRGFSAELPFIPGTRVRGLYADTMGERPAPPLSIEGDAFGDFASSAAPDTSVYRYSADFAGEDVWVAEFSGEAGSLAFGYARRANRGYQPGAVAEVTKTGPSFAASLYTTREFWSADVGWLGWRFLGGLGALAGFGRAETQLRSFARTASTIEELGDVNVGQSPEASDRAFPAQTDGRWIGGLTFERGRAAAKALLSRSRYDFDGGVHAPSAAAVGEFTLDGEYAAERWRAAGSLRYLDQDYGGSPDDFHFFTPQRNAWLDLQDRLTVGRMVSFDLEKSMEIEAAFHWGRRALSDVPGAPRDAQASGGPVGEGSGSEDAAGTGGGPADGNAGGPLAGTAATASVCLVSRGFLEAVEHVSVRVAAEREFRRGIFVQWDWRLARYHKPSWGLDETFFSTYLETGFRNRRMEASLGVGFDPVVLDPFVNAYADIGREEFLRRAIPERPARSLSALMGEGLEGREALLEDFSAVKLEIIVVF